MLIFDTVKNHVLSDGLRSENILVKRKGLWTLSSHTTLYILHLQNTIQSPFCLHWKTKFHFWYRSMHFFSGSKKMFHEHWRLSLSQKQTFTVRQTEPPFMGQGSSPCFSSLFSWVLITPEASAVYMQNSFKEISEVWTETSDSGPHSSIHSKRIYSCAWCAGFFWALCPFVEHSWTQRRISSPQCQDTEIMELLREKKVCDSFLWEVGYIKPSLFVSLHLFLLFSL